MTCCFPGYMYIVRKMELEAEPDKPGQLPHSVQMPQVWICTPVPEVPWFPIEYQFCSVPAASLRIGQNGF